RSARKLLFRASSQQQADRHAADRGSGVLEREHRRLTPFGPAVQAGRAAPSFRRQGDMLGYIVKRILAVIPVMAIVALIVFLILRLTPGDPAAIIAGDTATPDQIARLRESMGLN